EGGYATAAFVAAFVLDRRFGLAQGFELYEDRLWGPEPGLGPQTVELRGGLVAERAIRWIGEYAAERRSGVETRPFFLFVHFFDAHAPYVPPPPHARIYADQPYNGELAYQDACLGRLLDAIEAHGEASRTLVWVISDHGEALGEHGEPQHSIFLYDSTVRVVSILRLPSQAGRYVAGDPRLRIGAQTSLISVAPTLLALCGLSSAAAAATPFGEGRSLTPLLQQRAWEERAAYCETLSPLITYHWAPLYATRTTAHKYVRAPDPELYDLQTDPDELHNLIAERPAVQAELSAALDAYLEREGGGAALAQRRPSEEERARLRSLGYLSGGDAAPDPASREAAELPDPKRMLAAFDRRYQQAKGLMSQRRFSEAVEILQEAVRIDPLNSMLLVSLATSLRGAGRPDEASAAYREALRVRPDSPRTWHGWGQALLHAGRVDSALWAYERAQALQPRSPDPWVGRASAHWIQERFDQAIAEFDSALARGADPILVHGLLARLYRDELGDSARAEPHLRAYARLRRAPLEQAARHLPRIR
ncbi:MAG: sulfatase-like hydrolase/transferase, partial [Candidatus Eisenbacteria bacterium]|nr:sulfatase-like hydrolase/transferase [Candidatus Eisenbacteria bacterium]